MPIYKFILHFNYQDPRSAYYVKEAKALGLRAFRQIAVQDLYFVEGQLSQEELQQLTLKLLTDAVTQSATWIELPSALSSSEPDSVILEVALRAGVTDPVAEQIVRASHELGFDGVHRAATGQRFSLCFDETAESFSATQSIAKSLLANNVIQHWTIGEIAPSFPREVESSGTVAMLPIQNLSDNELLALSKDRRAAVIIPLRTAGDIVAAWQGDSTKKASVVRRMSSDQTVRA